MGARNTEIKSRTIKTKNNTNNTIKTNNKAMMNEAMNEGMNEAMSEMESEYAGRDCFQRHKRWESIWTRMRECLG